MAFRSCTGLREVYITDSVWEIGKSAFSDFEKDGYLTKSWLPNLSAASKNRLEALGYDPTLLDAGTAQVKGSIR
jgi:hypothetical protein